VWDIIKKQDTYLNQTSPWKLSDQDRTRVLFPVVDSIRDISFLLSPFLPETSQIIQKHFEGSHIQQTPPLFPKLD
ncbi:MAG: hypothetical protein N3A54_05600, partial [Patescibacteria group bacterium]|nr:hypothetical protein [Patescibacteria group bacterium]